MLNNNIKFIAKNFINKSLIAKVPLSANRWFLIRSLPYKNC